MPGQEISPKLLQAIANDRVGLEANARGEPVTAFLAFAATDEDLAEVCKLPTLEKLHSSNAKITDKSFVNIRSLKRLRFLDIWGAEVTDGALAALGDAKELQVLEIPHTKITGKGMAVLRNFPRLTELRCNPQQHLDEAVDAIRQCKAIKILDLDSGAFNNQQMSKLFLLPELEKLDVSQSTTISDDALRNVKDAKKLRLLYCSDMNTIGDRACEYLAEAQSLEKLIIGGTSVTDKGVAALSRSKTLRSLHVGETKVTVESLNLLTALPTLTELTFDSHDFKDEHIPLIERLTNLKVLHIWNTQMTKEGACRLAKTRKWINFTAPPQYDECAGDH